MAELNWSDAQWQKVNDAVTEAFNKSSIASALLPCYGPLPESTEYVREETFDSKDHTVKVSDDRTLKLFNLRVFVELSNEQVAEEGLSTALLAFRRAAVTLAQAEDDIVFNGHDNPSKGPKGRAATSQELSELPQPFMPDVVANKPDSLKGLINQGNVAQVKDALAKSPKAAKGPTDPADPKHLSDRGHYLASLIAKAVVDLEGQSHPGPFACVLGAEAFQAVHTPALGLLPADSIRPIINGPLLRSGRLPPSAGIVVSSAGANIDLVVATPPTVQFLQVNRAATSVFRVYEKFILRVKDETAVRPIGG